jgi:Zn-dependent protease
MLNNPLQFVINILYLLPALVVGIVAHELAHAAVAVARGDQTPRVDGRLSLNPRDQLDPLGTIAAFFIYFGWGRPMRLNPYRMRSPLDPVLVWLAGPVASLLLAILLSFPIKWALITGAVSVDSPVFQLLLVAFYVNVLLAVVNILPLPGLDGYNILGALFRRRFGRVFFEIDNNRQLLLLLAIVVVFASPYVLGVSIFNLLYTPVAALLLGGGVRPTGF